ncbi:MAG: Trp biosynthesis-associated membrane protein [Terrimesophilobacter sp.]
MFARRIKSLVILVGLALSALALISWTQPWFTLTLTGGSSAAHSITAQGDEAAPGLPALTLAALALIAALSLAGTIFRRILGVLELLIGASIVLAAAVALSDPVAAAAKLVTKATGVSGKESVSALVASVGQTPWPWIAATLGVAIGILGVVLLAVGRRWPDSSRRFQTTVPAENTGEGTATDWDRLSGGSDPTSR